MPVISARFLSSPAGQPTEKPFEVRDARLRGFILRVQPSGVRVYYAQVSRTRRVRIAPVGTLTPDEARDRCQQMIGNHAQGRPVHSGVTGVSTVTLRRFIDDTFHPWLLVNRPRSASKTMSALRKHFAVWDAYPMTEITAELIEEWKTKQLAAGAKPMSVRRNIDSLAGVFRRAVKAKEHTGVTVSPIRDVEKPKVDRTPKVRYLSDAEEKRLRDALTARDARMISARLTPDALRMRSKRGGAASVCIYGDHLTPAVLVTLNTGMRLGELLALRWDSVSFRQRHVTLDGPTTKSGQTRHIPLNAEAMNVLKAWQAECRDTERVFPFSGSFKTAWKPLLAAAKIARFRWHDLRHHFASMLAQKGVPLNTIRELLGHGSLAMVLRYAHLSPNQTRDAVDLL